jgi:transcriptional regulator with GAF, ATPase, and Fis domain
MLDEHGQSLGHLLILTELPEEEALEREDRFHGMIGRSPAMVAVFERIEQLSHSEVTVLITGESGTGKELAARAVHETSPRSRGPLLAVNCAALPEGLLESEIFGHVKGAFTGAVRDRKGRVELADGGSLFLDEVGELPLTLQSKLLRLVQERTFERLGEERTRTADIRIIAATNRDLAQEVAEGRFREDFYYRLKVVPIRMPQLRERGRDVAILATRLLERQARAAGREGMILTREALDLMLAYEWPGNVRELVNAVEYAVALARDEAVGAADLPPELGATQPLPLPPRSAPLSVVLTDEQEAAMIRQALERNGWHRLETARELEINRVTLYRQMKRYGIVAPHGGRRRRTRRPSPS